MANTMVMADDDDFETRPTQPCPPPEVERAKTLLPPAAPVPRFAPRETMECPECGGMRRVLYGLDRCRACDACCGEGRVYR